MPDSRGPWERPGKPPLPMKPPSRVLWFVLGVIVGALIF